ncbi:hypothetical protein GII36_00055 [Candidatus Mycosynbacter amalyticus]|uniref:Uncharacterized protein n=1 Tax=Candidatus Mycosynbacter amalyticus TaxID=2665156 RepID=A0A857MNJ1_9BACT|nr:hypothetical protein [Candidatus Mycosynbacter amalyticus]QHN42260.1 hypothetical protein GII36_00055 [Candidatus Mycosynbacter amalyticus]
MATLLDIPPEEEQEELNPAEKTFQDKVNSAIGVYQAAKQLSQAEKNSVDSDLPDQSTKKDDSSDKDEDPQPSAKSTGKKKDEAKDSASSDLTPKARDGEQNPMGAGGGVGGGGKGQLKGVKASGPIATIGAIIAIFGLIVIVFLSSPATLFAAIKANLTNARDTSAPAMNSRFLTVFSSMMPDKNNPDKAKKACEKPQSKMCRAVTAPEKLVKDLRKAGIKVELGDDVGDRKTIKSITVTDSSGKEHKVDSKTSTITALKSIPAFRAAINRAYDVTKKPFLSSRFKELLSTRWGITKGPGLEGKDKKELDKSFRQSMKLEGDPANGDSSKVRENREKQTSKLREKAGKLTSLGSSVVSLACTTYTTANAVVIGAKMLQIAMLVRFFMSFAVEFDKVIAGESDQQITDYIGGRLNYSETNPTSGGKPNRFYQTTFSDGEGMKMLLHGDLVELSTYALGYRIGGAAIASVSNVLSSFETSVGSPLISTGVAPFLSTLTGRDTSTSKKAGKALIKSMCSLINGQVAQTLGDAAMCAQLFGATGPGVLACIAAMPVIAAAIGALLAPIIGKFVEHLIDWLSKMPVDEETKGIDAGNALAAGVGLLMQNTALTNGLVFANAASYKGFLADTADDMSSYRLAEQYDAQATPFDATNQYSFLGSITHNLYNSGALTSSRNPASLLPNMLSSLSLAAKTVGSLGMTHAAQGTFNEMRQYDENEDSCPDPAVRTSVDSDPTHTFAGDAFCVSPTYMETEALTADATGDDSHPGVIKYMEDEGFINKDTGEIESSDKAKIYKKYNKYCVTRSAPAGVEDPGGSEDGSIAKNAVSEEGEESGEVPAEDESWATADWCTYPSDQAGTTATMLAMFHAYRADENIRDGVADEGEQKAEEATGEIGDDAKAAAQALLDSPNVKFQLPEQRGYMEQTAKDGTQTLDCGGKANMNGKLLGMLVEASKKYKITIGAQASGHECDGGWHPKGSAVDLNGVAHLDQPQQMRIDWTAADKPIVKEFYEYLDNLAGTAGVKLELGQKQCFSKPPSAPSPSLKNSELVTDVCNHMHVGVEQ